MKDKLVFFNSGWVPYDERVNFLLEADVGVSTHLPRPEAVYSVRARERPTVSTPVTWDEVERARRDGDAEPLSFEVREVLARVAEQGDLFAPVLSLRQRRLKQ